MIPDWVKKIEPEDAFLVWFGGTLALAYMAGAWIMDRTDELELPLQVMIMFGCWAMAIIGLCLTPLWMVLVWPVTIAGAFLYAVIGSLFVAFRAIKGVRK